MNAGARGGVERPERDDELPAEELPPLGLEGRV